MDKQYSTVVSTVNNLTGALVGCIEKGYNLIKDDKYKLVKRIDGEGMVMANVRANIRDIIEKPVQYAYFMILAERLKSNTNEIMNQDRNDYRVATFEDIMKILDVSETTLKKFLALMKAKGAILKTSFTTSGRVNGKVVKCTREAYCINPVYAMRGGYVSYQLYERFKPFMDPYLTKTDKDNFEIIRKMEAGENLKESKFYTSIEESNEEVDVIADSVDAIKCLEAGVTPERNNENIVTIKGWLPIISKNARYIGPSAGVTDDIAGLLLDEVIKYVNSNKDISATAELLLATNGYITIDR